MKKSKCFLLSVVVFSLSLLHGDAQAIKHIQPTLLFNKLVDDIKLYKFTGDGTRFIHAGDLYEHSMWVYFAFLELLENKSMYAANLDLSEREQEVAAFGAFLHDIGKAGRPELFNRTHERFFYSVNKNAHGRVVDIIFKPDHQEHPLVGFECVAASFIKKNVHSSFSRRMYIMGDGSSFDFDALFKEMGVTTSEQQLIVLMIGMHYEFGVFKARQCTSEQFFQKLQSFVDIVGYNQGVIDEKVLRLVVLIQVADVKGLVPVAESSTVLFPVNQQIMPTHNHELEVKDPFGTFGYTDEMDKNWPYKKMKELLWYFKNVYQVSRESVVPQHLIPATA